MEGVPPRTGPSSTIRAMASPSASTTSCARGRVGLPRDVGRARRDRPQSAEPAARGTAWSGSRRPSVGRPPPSDSGRSHVIAAPQHDGQATRPEAPLPGAPPSRVTSASAAAWSSESMSSWMPFSGERCLAASSRSTPCVGRQHGQAVDRLGRDGDRPRALRRACAASSIVCGAGRQQRCASQRSAPAQRPAERRPGPDASSASSRAASARRPLGALRPGRHRSQAARGRRQKCGPRSCGEEAADNVQPVRSAVERASQARSWRRRAVSERSPRARTAGWPPTGRPRPRPFSSVRSATANSIWSATP